MAVSSPAWGTVKTGRILAEDSNVTANQEGQTGREVGQFLTIKWQRGRIERFLPLAQKKDSGPFPKE